MVTGEFSIYDSKVENMLDVEVNLHQRSTFCHKTAAWCFQKETYIPSHEYWSEDGLYFGAIARCWNGVKFEIFCRWKNTISSKQTKMAKDLTISLHISSTRLQLLSLIATPVRLCFCYHGFIPSETFCLWTWVPIRFSTLEITALKSRYKLHFYTLHSKIIKSLTGMVTQPHFCLAAATLLQHHLHRKGEGIAMIHQSIHQRSSTF